METVKENEINLFSQDTKITGDITVTHTTRIHGKLRGNIHALPGSTLILSESSIIEGTIDGDLIFIAGFVQGDVKAKQKVLISKTGRLIGNIETESLEVEFGAFFDGKCLMASKGDKTSK